MPLHLQELSCDHSAPRLARAWVRLVLEDVEPSNGPWPGDVVPDVVMCASELVTTSLIASSTAMTLRLSAEPDLVRLSLVDDSPILTNTGDDSRLHVQNLSFRLIEAYSSACGINPEGHGRELWALFRKREPTTVDPIDIGG